jgi:hypothetical protein
LRLPPLLVLHGDADRVVSVRNATATALLWAQASGARATAERTVARGQRYPMRAVDFSCAASWPCRCAKLPGWTTPGAAALPLALQRSGGPDASALIWAFVARQFKKI